MAKLYTILSATILFADCLCFNNLIVNDSRCITYCSYDSQIQVMMNSCDMERLYRQNQRNKQGIRQNNNLIQCLRNDLKTQKQLNERIRRQVEDAKMETKRVRRQLDEERIDREGVQSRYTLVLRKMEEEVDQYKKKYSKLEQKIMPMMDSDTVRLKILNQVEGSHRLQLDNLNAKITSSKEQILRLKRQNEVLRHTLAGERLAHQQELRRVDSSRNSEIGRDTIDYLTGELWKEVEDRLKKNYEEARREAQFYKDKYFAVERKYQQKMKELQRDGL